MITWWEEEGVIPDLTPEIITELTRESMRAAQSMSDHLVEILRTIISLRDVILKSGGKESVPRIVRLDSREVPTIRGSYAVDSSFKTPLPLVYGDLFIVISGYVRYPKIRDANPKLNKGLKVLVKFGDELTGRVQTAISKITEMHIARNILKDSEFNSVPWDLLIFDGPLFPLLSVLIATSLLYEEEEKLIDESGAVAESCIEAKKTMMGIVKRVRSHFIGRGLIKILEEQGHLRLTQDSLKAFKRMNDKAIATLLLRPGEALIIGSMGSSPIIRKAIESEGGRKKRNFEKLLSEYPWVKDISICFIKPFRSKHVVRVEVADYGKFGLERILHWLNANSSNTACPYPIDQIDKMARMTDVIYEFARKLIIKEVGQILSKIARAEGLEEADLLLDFADLQKKIIPDMG